MTHPIRNRPLSKEARSLLEAGMAATPVGKTRPATLPFFVAAAKRIKQGDSERAELIIRFRKIHGGGA